MGGFFGRLYRRVPLTDGTAGADESPDLSELVEQAKNEWVTAQALFDSVNAPEMVDHAIHLIVAAEKKYTYLLREAKASGIHFEPLQGV